MKTLFGPKKKKDWCRELDLMMQRTYGCTCKGDLEELQE